jgi:hypothetical protein
MPRKESLKLNAWKPCIAGTKISTKEQLREILSVEYSTLFQKPNFANLLNEAQRHLTLIEEIQIKPQLKHGDLTRLAKKFQFSTQQVHKYLKYKTLPHLYWLLEKCTSKTEAYQRITSIFLS